MVRDLLITGASGFIGGALGQHFSKKPHLRVWSIGKSDQANSLTETIEAEKMVDFGILLNGWSGVEKKHSSDSNLQRASLREFRLQVESVLKYKPKFIIGFGSQSELTLNQSSDRPKSAYAQAKSEARSLLLDVCEKAEIKAHWLRIYSVYGQGMASSWILPEVARAIRTNSQLELGRCTQKWGFLHISDFCSAIEKIMNNSERLPFDIDVGGLANSSLKEQLTSLLEGMQSKVLLFDESKDPEADSIPNLRPLLELGWEQKVDLKTGFAELVENAG
jgi:nucleoside-diphosphate-sugar epimerase